MSEAWPSQIPAPSAPPRLVDPPRAPTTAEVRALDGEPVLVMPADSADIPAVGMRGSVRVAAQGQVDIELQFADMYDRPAEMKRIRLNSRQVGRLWASREVYGGYALRLDGPLDAPPTGERVVGRFGRGRPETNDTHNARPGE